MSKINFEKLVFKFKILRFINFNFIFVKLILLVSRIYIFFADIF